MCCAFLILIGLQRTFCQYVIILCICMYFLRVQYIALVTVTTLRQDSLSINSFNKVHLKITKSAQKAVSPCAYSYNAYNRLLGSLWSPKVHHQVKCQDTVHHILLSVVILFILTIAVNQRHQTKQVFKFTPIHLVHTRGSQTYFFSRFICSADDAQPWENSITVGPGKVIQGPVERLHCQCCCDNYIPSSDNLQRLFPFSVRPVVVFPLDPYGKNG